MKAQIYVDRAEYSINGEPYASATYEEGTVPTSGFFGFAVYYTTEHKVIDSVKITKL